ncbi:hypothetical protein MKW94_005448 [Papaver nudicaule]|uniref:O-fucosyltransferase family protein n=1 Tax=Papaver nudicaule TaxID=74823 RepID=A0AA42B2Q9_PAPNU|nr:hypothetical protein [Papaver nudicaule]
MAIFHRAPKNKQKPRSPILLLVIISISVIAFLFILSCWNSTSKLYFPAASVIQVFSGGNHNNDHVLEKKYLYWGDRIDCPGKHCNSCAGLGHQESSLRCALEEAIFLQRTFVMPSKMCISPLHNKMGSLDQSSNSSAEDRWMKSFCAMDSLYDLELISKTVPVILDNSKFWYHVLSTSMKLGARGVAHVQGISRNDLKEDKRYSNLLLINRTASPLAWFMECKDRKNHSVVALPYTFLPSMATKKLQRAADQIKQLLGDYDAIHVRRGDILKTRKDRLGTERSLHPHLDRDTRPEFILRRIAKWVEGGRTIFIASNERTPGFFSPLSSRYRIAYSSNFSRILDPVIENNYQLFMLERLIMRGAKTFIGTYKDNESDLSLTDDPKKNTKIWQIPVYTMDSKES